MARPRSGTDAASGRRSRALRQGARERRLRYSRRDCWRGRRHDRGYPASEGGGGPDGQGGLCAALRLQSLSHRMMAEVIQVTTAPGLTFDVLAGGPEHGAPVLLLHGFAESFHTWDAQIAALARTGYRVIAPSQRGYSAGARPDAANTDNY